MAKGNLRLVNPRAKSREPGPTPTKSRWDGNLRRKVVALIDTGRPNGDVTLAGIAEHLAGEYLAEIVNIVERPADAESPTETRQLVDKICKEANIVISALSS